ncbi:MAG: TIM barrel protein [Victivallaceae bacterium]
MNSNSVQTQISKIAPWDEGAPVLHSPLRYGARVNNSFYLPVACVGARPLVFSAEGLPRGLNINPGSGIITGKTEKEGEYQVLLNAENIHGKNVRELNIVTGETLALTPPLGWSSWNCFGSNIDAQKIMTAAKAMVSSDMAAHGYTYVNIDDWPGPAEWNFTTGPATIGLVPEKYRKNRVKALKKAADFASGLGLPAIVTHLGFIPENPGDPAFAGTLDAVTELALYLKARNMEFWFETGQETPIALLRFIRAAGMANTGVNLDPTNLIMYGKGNPVDALDILGEYVKCVHVKDGLYPADPMQLGREVRIGSGQVDFPALILKLKEKKYAGPFIIEREISGETQRKDIQCALKYLEELL